MAPPPDQTNALRRFSPAQVDAAVAFAALAVSLGLLAAGDPGLWDEPAGTQALALGLLALGSLPLLAVRRAPLAVFVFTAVAQSALHQVATPVGPPVGPTVAVFVLGFSGGGSLARTRLTLVVVLAMLLLHAFSTSFADDRWFPGPELLFGTVLWGGAWLAGDRTRLRRERMLELEDRALRAEREAERERNLAAAEERTRIARDLHDSAGHAINVILVHAGAGRLQVERDPERAREAFRTIEDVARETVVEIDQMVGALREDGGERGVEPPPGLAALAGLAERRRETGTEVTLSWRGERRPLPPAVDRGAYRIVQEALTNTARHGDGGAAVEVRFGTDELELTVVNPTAAEVRGRGEGHGLVGMRERAAQLGGRLDVDASRGGFRVRAWLPLAEGQR